MATLTNNALKLEYPQAYPGSLLGWATFIEVKSLSMDIGLSVTGLLPYCASDFTLGVVPACSGEKGFEFPDAPGCGYTIGNILVAYTRGVVCKLPDTSGLKDKVIAGFEMGFSEAVSRSLQDGSLWTTPTIPGSGIASWFDPTTSTDLGTFPSLQQAVAVAAAAAARRRGAIHVPSDVAALLRLRVDGQILRTETGVPVVIDAPSTASGNQRVWASGPIAVVAASTDLLSDKRADFSYNEISYLPRRFFAVGMDQCLSFSTFDQAGCC